jgi:hypothetical protein
MVSDVVDTLRIPAGESNRRVRSRLGTRKKRPVIAVFGSTASLDNGLAHEIAPVVGAIVEAACSAEAVIVTGGTDAGVIRLVGPRHGRRMGR